MLLFDYQYLVPDVVEGDLVVSAFADPITFTSDVCHTYYLTIIQVTEVSYDVVFARWAEGATQFMRFPGPFPELLDVNFFRANTVFADYVSRLVSRMGTKIGVVSS